MDPIINAANTGWVLICAALVMLMTPAVALFYGGMSRSKSVLNMLMMSFTALGVVSVVWVTFGYAVAFGSSRGGLVGWSPGLLGLEDLVRGVALDRAEGGVVNTFGLPDLTFAAFQLMFAVVTVALISGAVADRVRFGGWVAFVVLWVTVVYLPVAHWVFAFGVAEEGGKGAGASAGLFAADSGGWIVNRLGALDFAGGTAVHVNAGAAALALVLVLGRRHQLRQEALRPHNMPLVMVGVGLMWFGWFGFNGGSALAANGLASLAFVNTQVGTAAALLAWVATERLRGGHATTLGAASGAVAGLVAITPACGAVTPLGALAVGAVAGVVCCLAVSLKHRLGYDDALDVVAVHFVGGVVGTLMIGVVADSEFAAGYESLLDGGSPALLGRQALAVAAVTAYSFTVTLLVALLVKRTVGLRVSTEAEVIGVDEALHAETAYELAEIHPALRIPRQPAPVEDEVLVLR